MTSDVYKGELTRSSIAALAELAGAEAQAGRFDAAAGIARIACSHAGDELLAEGLLAFIAHIQTDADRPPMEQRAAYHLARARAYVILGAKDRAEAEFRAAFAADMHADEAYIGLGYLRLPGEPYVTWLARFHQALRPECYLEIGVEFGHTLALAQPPTLAIGVDPEPHVAVPFRAQTQVLSETSNDFFSNERLVALLGHKRLNLVFIDGLHVFEQSLRDFINAEQFATSAP